MDISQYRLVPLTDRAILTVMRLYFNSREPVIARAAQRVWKAQGKALTDDMAAQALATGDLPAEWWEQAEAGWALFVAETLDPEWRNAMTAAGKRAAQAVNGYKRKGWGLPFAEEPIGQAIDAWIQRRGGELMVDWANRQQETIRAALAHYTTAEPTGPYELARNLRPLVGMTPRQAEAVQRFRAQLAADGVMGEALEKQVGKFAAYQNRIRANRIARTELAYSYSNGQHVVMREAMTQGWFAGPVVKSWSVADDERLCPVCEELDGITVGMEELFPGGVLLPPRHPGCRCAANYAVAEMK